MARWLLAAAAATTLSLSHATFADDPPAQSKSDQKSAAEPSGEAVALNDREQAFSDLLNNSALVGTFTVERGDKKGGGDRPLHEERYVIKGVKKLSDGQWVINSQIVYGKFDVTVPVPVQVDWAGDTPVLSVTDLTIPLVGSEFTARVMFYDGRYAGTWRHGKVGGLMFGRVETSAEAPSKSAPEEKAPGESEAKPKE